MNTEPTYLVLGVLTSVVHFPHAYRAILPLGMRVWTPELDFIYNFL